MASIVTALCRREIILEVPDRLAGKAAVALKETMIEAGEACLSGVQIEVEVTVGDSWSGKWKNRRLPAGKDKEAVRLTVTANSAKPFG